MPKTLITILFLLFLVPAQAQTDSSTLLLKLSIKQATEVNHTFKFPLEQLKKIKKIEIECTDCDGDETFKISEVSVIVSNKRIPTVASNYGPEFTDGIVELIKEMNSNSIILLDKILLRSALGSETIQLKPISIIPKL